VCGVTLNHEIKAEDFFILPFFHNVSRANTVNTNASSLSETEK
jgi:hypothetical protein